MASSGKVVNAQCFHELWASLSKPHNTASERASAYQALAGYLKAEVSEDFVIALCQKHKTVIQLVVGDITGCTCAQEAIQLLGYCLFTPQFAEACGDDAGKIISVLCTVPYDKATEKSVITRSLWCLSSQNFRSDQISHSIPQIITLATDIIMEYGFGSLAVEALNVFLRINQQCPKEFGLVASMWYKGIIVLLECKVAKFQRKAYSFAVPFESAVASNTYLVCYLTKELKDHVISSMIGYMEERGKDPILILNIWSHFVCVLRQALHKHSSFLNEMLRVVELGFKHKVFLVQVASYASWKVLINNFSIDMELLTQQRRLKLLLMPLLASAVKDRHEQVEVARLQTWWHLIRKLGLYREPLFHQVCIPFLLFCLGVDPKMDLSKLSSILSDSASSGNGRGMLHVGKMSPVPQNKENVPTSECPVGQTVKAPSGQGFETPASFKAGRLLTLLSNLSLSSSGKKSDRYQSTPKLSLVLSGCHAVLQFLGFQEKLQGSLLDTDDEQCVVYEGGTVPTSVVQFLVAFLDGIMLYMVHYSKEVKGCSVEYLVKSLFTVFLHNLRQEDDSKSAAHLAVLLVGMLKWEAVITHVTPGTRLDILHQFINLPSAVTTAICNTHGSHYWFSVGQELIAVAHNKHSNPIFLNCWTKLLEVSTSQVHATLTVFGNLCDLLDRFAELVVAESSRRQQLQLIATLNKMWSSLAQNLISYVKETSQVNEGTSLSPDFTVARRILKFPFHHRTFYNAEKSKNPTFERWKELYDIFNMHTSLVVKDPNHCAELVCRDLYDCYGQNVRSDSATLDRGETVNFDTHENVTGLALTRVLTKFNWTSLKASTGNRETGVSVGVGGRGGEMEVGGTGGKSQRETASKNLQLLISLLSWQLATLWDTVQRSPLHIGSLLSPYTLMEIVTLLYGNLPTPELIHSTTEMLAQPMVTLWQNVLHSDHEPRQRTGGSLHKSPHKGPFNLPERIIKTWRSILTCFRSRYTFAFNSEILSVLSPLLVFALSSMNQELVNMTLNFWKATFGLAEHLEYPNKLRDAFVKFQQSDVLLKLPGFEVSRNVQHPLLDNKPVSESKPPQTIADTTAAAADSSRDSAIVIPHPSPQKGVRGSFLGQKRSPKPSTPPRSPAAQAMDEILVRSRGRQQATGHSSDSSVGKSPALSARRRLSLNTSKEDDYVSVDPPAKRQQLLTDHQKEKLRERSDSIPTMYNALDPSQDATQCTAQSTIPDSGLEEPIIIPESEGSPAAAVSTRPTVCSENVFSSVNTLSASSASSSLAVVTAVCSQHVSPSTATVPTSSVVAAMSTSVVNVSGVPVSMQMSCGHVRTSPIATRTRSRLRPELSTPTSRSLPFPKPSSLGCDMPSPQAHLWTFSPRGSTGQLVATCGHTAALNAFVAPSSVVSQQSTVANRSPFSPTDQHYQSLQAQQIHPRSGVPTTSVERQKVYKMHYTTSTGPVVIPLPANQHISTIAGQQIQGTHFPEQFVPAVSPTSPIINAPMQIPMTSAQNLQHMPSEPTFPPARYIIRSPTSRPPPPPYSLHSPVQIQRPFSPHAPLPLSAVIRPKPPVTRCVSRSRVGQQLPSPTPTSGGLLLTAQPSFTATGSSVDSPIIIEDVEDPLCSVTTSEQGPAVESVADSVCEGRDEPLGSDSRREFPAEKQPSVSKDSSSGQAEETTTSQHVSLGGCPETAAQEEEEDMEVYEVEKGELDQGSTNLKDNGRVVSSEGSATVVGGGSGSGKYIDNPSETSTERNGEPQPVTIQESPIESESMSESCQPGPSLLDRAVLLPASEGFDPNSQLCSTTELDKTSVTARDRKQGKMEQEQGSMDTSSVANETEEKMEVEGTAGDHAECIVRVDSNEKMTGESREEASEAELHSCVNESDTHQTMEVGADKHSAAKSQDVSTKEPITHATEIVKTQGSFEKEGTHKGVTEDTPKATEKKGTHESAEKADTHQATGKGHAHEVTDTHKGSEKEDTHEVEDTHEDTEKDGTHDGAEKDTPKVKGTYKGSEKDTREGAKKEDTHEVKDTYEGSEKEDTHEVKDTYEGVEKKGTHEASEEQEIHSDSERHDRHDAAETQLSTEEMEKSSCDVGGETEDEVSPLRTLKEMLILPVTPTNAASEVQGGDFNSPKTTPGGILKYTSQFDTPTALGGKVRRVQFASSPVVFASNKREEESLKTPKPSRTRTPLSSRRTLLKSDPNSRVVQVHKSPSASAEPVYPALTECDSPVEDILPVLSPSRRFTHGLVHLVHAHNIRTVGNISSLTEQQVQTLPIKTPKVEILKQALRNFQHQLGTKRRASTEADNLGPPAKAQKRDSNSPTEDADLAQESGDREGAVEGEDSNSQLSLASQSSPVEPSVVLSSPTDDSESANVRQNEVEAPKSGVVIEDDDNVFMEGTTTTTSSDGDNNISADKHTTQCTMKNRATERALERACPSPPMSVRSPEIPLQSSPSKAEPPSNAAGTECGQSVRDSVSSDDSEELRMETEEGGRVVASADSVEQAQQQSSLHHDHPYHLLGQQKEPCNDEKQSTSINATSSAVPVVTSTCTSAELVDHSYCSMTLPTSLHQTASVTSATVQPMYQESESFGTVSDLRSKLSSDVQDHNYCRLPAPNSLQTASEAAESVVCEAHITGDNHEENISESQELFSVPQRDKEQSAGDSMEPVDADPSTTSTTDIGCQTENVELPSRITLDTPVDKSIPDSLKSIIDTIIAEENLPSSTLWRVHRELVRGLSVVSDKLSSERF